MKINSLVIPRQKGPQVSNECSNSMRPIFLNLDLLFGLSFTFGFNVLLLDLLFT